jgi:hypothetical protein
MTSQAAVQQQPATASGATGPRTEAGKARCRLNAFRHGLTSQVFVFTADEAPAYRNHHAEIAKHYQPFGPIETALADQISSGIWRLQRVHAIEEGLFALDAETGQSGDTVDGLFGPARTWLDQSKSLRLLHIYEGRIRRALDRDKAELAVLQSARKQEASRALDQAVALDRLAKAEGKPYDPAILRMPPLTPESVFSTDAVSAESIRREALLAAQARIAQLAKQARAA